MRCACGGSDTSAAMTIDHSISADGDASVTVQEFEEPRGELKAQSRLCRPGKRAVQEHKPYMISVNQHAGELGTVCKLVNPGRLLCAGTGRKALLQAKRSHPMPPA